MNSKWGKLAAAAGVALAAGAGGWWYKHREPPDITEAQAKEKATAQMEGACGEHEGPIGACSDFKLQAEEASPDKRFKWAFRYENLKPEKAQRILVLVGQKGDVSTQVGFFTPDAGQLAALSAAVKPAAALPAPASWTLCELPPELP